ncbi:NfeD family protein [Haemophilus paraphrohaemolyticus]
MMDWLTTWSLWHWLILGFMLLIGEVLTPGVFLMWWGFSALVTALLQWLFPALPLSVFAIFYAILACILSVIWWKYQNGKDRQAQSHSSLNQRDHALIGKFGTVQEISSNGIGRGIFGDTTWRIQGEQLAVGDLIYVERVEGITLIVKKSNK